MIMETTDEKAEEYSAALYNQSGTYSKGEIETAFVSGFNSAMEEIGGSCDGSKPGRLLFVSKDEYYAIKNSISSIHQVIGVFQHEGPAKTRRLEFAKMLEDLIKRYEDKEKL